ncbi:hypothetical protein RhiirA1_486018, partial [Rhizophagus irregularis]
MDQCMIALPSAYNVGEKVILIGKQNEEEITIDEWAAKVETINYEIPSDELKEIEYSLPQEMLIEFNQTLEQKFARKEEYVIVATRRLSTHKQPNQIREALMKGY